MPTKQKKIQHQTNPLPQTTRIAIAIPDNHPTFNKRFILSLFGMFGYAQSFALKQKMETGRSLDLFLVTADKGWIDDMRNALAKESMKADYILWLDSDMTFPDFTLIRMLKYFEQDATLEAVTGLYTYKTPPYVPHVYHEYNANKRKFKMAASFPLDKAFPVAGAAFGCLMMKTSVFKRIKQPYFRAEVRKGIMMVGEDLDFCRRTHMKMIMDPQISCGHIKENEYGIGSHIEFNGLKVKDGTLVLTKDKMRDIMKLHLKK